MWDLLAETVSNLFGRFVFRPLWRWVTPGRFTVRYLLIVVTVLAVLLGTFVALDAMIVGNAR